jgi:hypothetical protein
MSLEVNGFDNSQIYERKDGEDTPVAPFYKRNARVSQPSSNGIEQMMGQI